MTARRIPIWSRVAFVLLLPFAAYSLWDYVESRRLDSRLTAIRERGEPTTPPYHRPTGDAAQAERFYRAASTLVTDLEAPLEIRNRVGKAWREGQWTPETLKAASAEVAGNREALDYVDRAANLPFVGFPGGTSYNYLTGNLWRLVRLCEWRAAVMAGEGNGDAALASFAAEARLVRAMDLGEQPLGALPGFFGLSQAMARITASASARESTARALADIDRDDRHTMAVLQFRTAALRGPDYRGPIITHFLVASLDVAADLLAAAQQPWPARLDAMNAVGGWPLGGFPPRSEGAKTMLRGFTRSTAEQTKRIRCARLIVSTTPLDLVDPFTGKRLEASSCHL